MGDKRRTFVITDTFIGNTSLPVRVKNYRWSNRRGLQCEMWPGIWVKSDYTLTEFLNRKDTHFRENNG